MVFPSGKLRGDFGNNVIRLSELRKFIFQNKNDLPPTTLFEYYKDGAPDKITEIAKYCIKDCVLCNSLLIKLDVVTKNIGMSNVCCVPLSYLFLRGQGLI